MVCCLVKMCIIFRLLLFGRLILLISRLNVLDLVVCMVVCVLLVMVMLWLRIFSICDMVLVVLVLFFISSICKLCVGWVCGMGGEGGVLGCIFLVVRGSVSVNVVFLWWLVFLVINELLCFCISV